MTDTKPKKKIGYGSPPGTKGLYSALSPSDLRLLYFLTDEADRLGTRTVQAYALDLAKATGMTRRRVHESVARLKEKQYIEVERTFGRYGNGPNKFTILNPDEGRRQKIKLASDISGIPLTRMVDYIYWLHFHRAKLTKLPIIKVGDVAYFARLKGDDPAKFVEGVIGAGIMTTEGQITL